MHDEQLHRRVSNLENRVEGALLSDLECVNPLRYDRTAGVGAVLAVDEPDIVDPLGPQLRLMSPVAIEITADERTVYDAVDLIRDEELLAWEIVKDPDDIPILCWAINLSEVPPPSALTLDETNGGYGDYLCHLLNPEAHGPNYLSLLNGNEGELGDPLAYLKLITDPTDIPAWDFTPYASGSFSDHSGQFWEATVDTTGEPGIAGWTVVPVWAAGAYVAGDSVENVGKVWTALVNTSEEPDVGALDWQQEVADAWALTGSNHLPGELVTYSATNWAQVSPFPSDEEPGTGDVWQDVGLTFTNIGSVNVGNAADLGSYGKETRPTRSFRMDCCRDEDVDDPPECGCPPDTSCSSIVASPMAEWYFPAPYTLDGAAGVADGFNYSYGVLTFPNDGATNSTYEKFDVFNASPITSYTQNLIDSPGPPETEVLVEIYGAGGNAYGLDTAGILPEGYIAPAPGGPIPAQGMPCGGGSGGHWAASLITLDNPPYSATFDPITNSIQFKDGSNTVLVQAACGIAAVNIAGNNFAGAPARPASDSIGQRIHVGGRGGSAAMLPYYQSGQGGQGGSPLGDGADGQDATGAQDSEFSNFPEPGYGASGVATFPPYDVGVSGGSYYAVFSEADSGQVKLSFGDCAILPIIIPPGDGSGTSPTVNPANTLLPDTGTTLIITGTNFNTTAANNTVAFSGGATGTVTAVNAAGTQITVTGITGLVIGPLTVIVTDTITTLTSALPVTVANVVVGPFLADTSGTQTLGSGATAFTLDGSGFNGSVPSNNIVSFNFGALGHITNAATTHLIGVFDTPPSGFTEGQILTATVTSNGVTSNLENVATLTLVLPTIQLDTTDQDYNDTTLAIVGTGFDAGTPGNNVVTLSNGAVGLVTASTGTTLTVTYSQKPTTYGPLTAIVTVNGVSSRVPVQVANITAKPFISAGVINIAWNSLHVPITGGNFNPTIIGTATGTVFILYLGSASPTFPGSSALQTYTNAATPTSALVSRGLLPSLPSPMFQFSDIGQDVYAVAALTGPPYGSSWPPVKIGIISAAPVAIISDTFTGVNGTLLSAHNPDTMPLGFVYSSILTTAMLELQGGKAVGSVYETLAGDDWSGVSFDCGATEATVSIDFTFVAAAFSEVILFCRFVAGANPQGYAVRVGADNSAYGDTITIQRWDGVGGITDLVSAPVALVDGSTYTLSLANAAGVMTATINGVPIQWTATEWNTVTDWGYSFIELAGGGAVHTAAAFDELRVTTP